MPHGYFPINNSRWPGTNFTTLQWAGDGVKNSENVFNWNNALDLYKSGKKREAYLCLGHLLHLLADLSVPAHVNVVDHGTTNYIKKDGTSQNPDLVDIIMDAYETALNGGFLSTLTVIPNLSGNFVSSLGKSSIDNIPVYNTWQEFYRNLANHTYGLQLAQKYYARPLAINSFGFYKDENGYMQNVTEPVIGILRYLVGKQLISGRYVKISLYESYTYTKQDMITICDNLVPKATEYLAGLILHFIKETQPNQDCTDQHEPNDGSASASLIFAQPLNDNSSDLTWNGNIGWTDDQDWFKINLGYKGTLTINLTSLPFDCDLELYGPGGLNEFISPGSYNNGTNSEKIIYKYTGSSIKTVYAKVYAKNPGTYSKQACYDIQFQWIPSNEGSCIQASISTQPSNQIATVGSTATFNVTVTGSVPYSYFWYKNGTLQTSTINSLSNTNKYKASTLTSSDNNSKYYCLIKNCSDTKQAISSVAILTVNSLKQKYNVTTSSNPATGGTTSGGGTYEEGEIATLTATSYPGYTFVNWTENGNHQAAITPYQIGVGGHRNLVANFSNCSFTLDHYNNNAIAASTSDAFWLITTSDCSWAVATSGCENMIALKNTSGKGKSLISFDISENKSISPRECKVMVGGQTYTVTQAGYIAPCSTKPADAIDLTGYVNGSDVLHLQWHGNYTNVTDFQIERAESDAGPFKIIGSSGRVFGYDDKNVIGGNTYYYRVRACCNSNCSEYSNILPLMAYTFSTAQTGMIATRDTIFQGESVKLTVEGGSLGTGAEWTWRTVECHAGTIIGNGSFITVSPNANTYYFVKPDGQYLPNNIPPIKNCAYKLITVKPKLQIYSVTTICNPANGGSTSGDGKYSIGQYVTVTATPSSEFTFKNWTENGSVVYSSSSYNFTVSGDRTLVANFDYKQNINACNGIPTITYSGKTYNTVKIGNQCWLRENLDVGVMIQGSQNQSNDGTIEKYCYNNDVNNCKTYGGLYQWNEAMAYSTIPGAQGICPTGWHIPTDVEFQTLRTSVNNDCNALLALGQGSGLETNSSGFTALLAGANYYNGSLHNFNDLGNFSNCWYSIEASTTNAYYQYLMKSIVQWANFYKENGFSVRCIKDEIGTAIDGENGNGLPQEYSVTQNYPNPFNPETVISYQLSANGKVTLKVFDALGIEVAELVNEEKAAGKYEVIFDGRKLSSGIYFYTIKAGNFTQTKKLVLLK